MRVESCVSISHVKVMRPSGKESNFAILQFAAHLFAHSSFDEELNCNAGDE